MAVLTQYTETEPSSCGHVHADGPKRHYMMCRVGHVKFVNENGSNVDIGHCDGHAVEIPGWMTDDELVAAGWARAGLRAWLCPTHAGSTE